ncbi:MAG: UDP-N-acetylmuramyl pentapeptide phosphotransferase/UDP-N-acetylglucosamine-1-phosphate transferase [Rhodobacteraceae bacterium HLUCCA12]|nr:MAG: UDP-N-acetylmuramyl pentapeptide phosphotransferase/UDP-N-acetylglucosamine-1-phosphate transferase [Rhodobacteraceae bacterium HLUCCA12]
MYEFFDIRFGFAFIASGLACISIIMLSSANLRIGLRREDILAVQSAHSQPTPRIGGVALVLSLLGFSAFVPSSVLSSYMLFCLSLAPVFAAGLCEDLGRRVPPRYRMAASALSSLFAIALFQTWFSRTDIVFLDPLMAFAPFAIAMTVFMGATACNAFNLIDGLNGMAAGTAILAALGLAAIAVELGDTLGVQASFLLVAALFGFLLFNYPFGKIFLGDAGAYSIGFILVWIAVYLMSRSPDLSGVALILIFFWPTADTIFSIYRRSIRRRAVSQPDRLHYHQFVMRALEVVWLGRGSRHVANPLATTVLMPLVATPVLLGVAFWNNTQAAAIALIACSIAFVASYVAGIRLAPKLRRAGAPALQPIPGE